MKYIFLLFVVALPTFALSQKTPPSFEQWRSKRDSSSLKDEFIEVTKEPKPLNKVMVPYPPKAKKAGIQGKVAFSALIGIDGKVEKVHIDHSDHKIFNQAVIDAVRKIEFKPALDGNNKPVRVWYSQTISFKIMSNADEQDYH